VQPDAAGREDLHTAVGRGGRRRDRRRDGWPHRSYGRTGPRRSGVAVRRAHVLRSGAPRAAHRSRGGRPGPLRRPRRGRRGTGAAAAPRPRRARFIRRLRWNSWRCSATAAWGSCGGTEPLCSYSQQFRGSWRRRSHRHQQCQV